MDKYRHNYLTTVIARVDFALPPENLDLELPNGLMQAIKSKFPIPAAPIDHIHRKVAVKPETANLKVMGTERWKEWNFHTRKRDRFVSIEHDHFLIQYVKFDCFAVLKRDFLLLVKWITNEFPDVTLDRLGLRYVNTFTFPKEDKPLDWSRWIHRKFLAPLGVPSAGERRFISRSLQNMELNYGDMLLRLQYGIANPDYPSPIKQKQFMFDTDAFCMGLFDASEIPGRLDSLYAKISQLFETYITDDMRAHLNAPRRK